MRSINSKILLAVAVVLLAAAPMLLIVKSGGEESASTDQNFVTEDSSSALEDPAELPAIVYAGFVDGDYRLFAVDPEGGAPVPVTEDPGSDPAWSPDGTELLFVGETLGTTQKRLGLLKITGDRKITPVKKGPQIPSRISFRGTTDEVALQSTLQTTGATAGIKYRSTIDSVNLEDGSQRTLFDANGSAYSPAWSPDGTRLLVIAGEAGCRSKGVCPQRLEMLRPDGTLNRSLITTGAAGSPDWSPDGGRITFTWDQGDGPGLWIMGADGSSPRRLIGGKSPVTDPVFSEDGKEIVFSRSCDLFIQPVAGGPARNVTRSPETCEITPDWRRAQS